MSNKQFNKLEIQFQEECKVINLRYEYDGYIGNEQWAIISELTEKEILEKYRPIVSDYICHTSEKILRIRHYKQNTIFLKSISSRLFGMC